MRRLVSCSFLLACSTAPHPTTIAAEPATHPAPRAALQPPPPDLDEAKTKAKSHAFFDAMDRADVAAFTELVGPSFVLFESARTYDAKFIAGSLQARVDRHAPIRSRTWNEERIRVGPGVAVFMGEAVEQFPAEPDRPASTEEAWHTLVWVRDGERWQVAHYQWQKGGVEAEREAWNDRFRTSVGFNHAPNRFLGEIIKGRKPGAALDVAMGQGRNALLLASSGWRTTGVDLSDEGIRIAKEAAASQKLKLDTVLADLDTWDFGKDKWDLVTLIYAGSNPAEIEKIKASVRKGGLVVVEFFHKDAIAGTGIGGFVEGELAARFAEGWKILRDEVVEDISDWGLRKTKLVRFAAQKL